MNNMNGEVESKYVYKVSWFESRRHKNSHTIMYFESQESVKWVLNTFEWYRDLARVEFIKVDEFSREYESAVNNTKLNSSKNDRQFF